MRHNFIFIFARPLFIHWTDYVFLPFFISTRRMQPFDRGCIFFLGTWSHLYLLRGPCLLCFEFVIRYIDFLDGWPFVIVIYIILHTFVFFYFYLLFTRIWIWIESDSVFPMRHASFFWNLVTSTYFQQWKQDAVDFLNSYSAVLNFLFLQIERIQNRIVYQQH